MDIVVYRSCERLYSSPLSCLVLPCRVYHALRCVYVVGWYTAATACSSAMVWSSLVLYNPVQSSPVQSSSTISDISIYSLAQLRPGHFQSNPASPPKPHSSQVKVGHHPPKCMSKNVSPRLLCFLFCFVYLFPVFQIIQANFQL